MKVYLFKNICKGAIIIKEVKKNRTETKHSVYTPIVNMLL
jgi:hypothetical protein